MSIFRLLLLSALIFVATGCVRSERMENLYAQRCLGCHGPSGSGDGPIAASLPADVPNFNDTVRNKSVTQIRKIIMEGKGIMPAYEPALRKPEIQDMVLFTRILSQRGRNVEWWERFDPLVWAHCNVPWEMVLGYDQPPEENKPR